MCHNFLTNSFLYFTLQLVDIRLPSRHMEPCLVRRDNFNRPLLIYGLVLSMGFFNSDSHYQLFYEQFINLVEESKTFGSIECDSLVRKRFARQSGIENLKNDKFKSLFPELTKEIRETIIGKRYYLHIIYQRIITINDNYKNKKRNL